MWIASFILVLVALWFTRPHLKRIWPLHGSRERWASEVPGAVPIGEAVDGCFARVVGVVRRVSVPGDGSQSMSVLISDPSGEMRLICARDQVRRFFTGFAVIVEGHVEKGEDELTMIDPRVLDEVLAPVG
jgi:hypothetical protein